MNDYERVRSDVSGLLKQVAWFSDALDEANRVAEQTMKAMAEHGRALAVLRADMEARLSTDERRRYDSMIAHRVPFMDAYHLARQKPLE